MVGIRPSGLSLIVISVNLVLTGDVHPNVTPNAALDILAVFKVLRKMCQLTDLHYIGYAMSI